MPQIISLFAESPLSTRCFLRLRSMLTPYERIAAVLPARGRVLDLGSGHGLLAFTILIAFDLPRRRHSDFHSRPGQFSRSAI